MKRPLIPHRKARPRGLRKNVLITVILLNGKRQARPLRTAARKLLTDVGLDALLSQEAELVETCFPGLEFRLVPLRDGNFNFVEVKKDPVIEELVDAIFDPAPDAAQTA